jgi:release factor glutamine methyltransferase
MTGDPSVDFKAIIHHPEQAVNFCGIDLIVMDGVFTPDPAVSLSSVMIANSVGSLEGKTVLDMGCGTGALAIYALKRGALKALAVDIDEHARENAQLNIQNSGYSNVIEIRRSDIFDNIKESFDIIFANLPINDHFWKSDSGTLAIAERFISSYRSHLNKNGLAYLAWGSFGDVVGLRAFLKRNGISYHESVKKDNVYTWSVFILSK